MESTQDTHGEDYYRIIAENYTKMKNMEYRQLLEVPNFKMLLDRVDVNDKDVIDLACGSGYYTRILRD
jgi:predicted methyltransferase